MKSIEISACKLNRLIAALDVKAEALSEYVLSPGHSLIMKGHESPAIHYVLEGTGLMYVHNNPPVKIFGHTLILVPPNYPFRLEVFDEDEHLNIKNQMKIGDSLKFSDKIFSLNDARAECKIILICCIFKTLCGSMPNFFETLSGPIVQNFCAIDRIDAKLEVAMSEFTSKEIGSDSMTAALLKQIIVSVVRKSLDSMDLWVERFRMLSDPKIAHAFAEMIAQPSKIHSIHTLAESACLSRSAFMVRFTNAIGRSPMMVLRDLRMRQAATDLLAGNLSLDHVIRNTGYASRSSFSRAFKEAYGVDPFTYQKSTQDQKSV